jgi:nucleoside-diphosphate-sugar epimerase
VGPEEDVRVLITGASGFLGGHLVDECVRRGDRVRVLVRETSDLSSLSEVPGLDIVRGGLSDDAALLTATKGVDVVFHSAARTREFGTRRQFWTANVDGTVNLLAAARRSEVRRFIHVSSPSVVMDGRDQADIDERVPYPPRLLNLYAASKAAAEQAVLAANDAGFLTCALRPRAIWGPGDFSGFIPRLLARMHKGTLPDLSPARPVHVSMCYCVNAARALRLAADSDRVGGRAYFITDSERTDAWALIREVAAMFGVRPPERRIPPPLRDGAAAVVDTLWRLPPLAARYPPPITRYTVALLTRTSTYDTSAATRDFGYRPCVDQRTGLLALKQWVDRIGGVERLAKRVAR